MLHGRIEERAALTALVDGAQAGRAGVLVVLGEPGIGKTALLQDLELSQQVALGGETTRWLRTRGVESESPLPFAALHRLVRPVVDFDRIPARQARALHVAFGLEDGHEVEPFMVGMATLSVLTDAAGNGTLVCIVDDAHWLDAASADALLFAARQLDADPVVMVFAARSTMGSAFKPHDLPVLELRGLDNWAARQLLDERGGEPMPGEVAERLIRDSGGNPLALLELPTGLSPAQLHGDAAMPQQLTLSAGLERAFLDRCRRLSERAQTLLLVAAADDTGRASAIREAASQLGVQPAAWGGAEDAGLLTVTGDVVVVEHPLVRSAVYQAATGFERRRAHQALAGALRDVDPDRATWHRASAADLPDHDLADGLHNVGVRAEQRGGYVAAAAAFERAAALTSNEPLRAARLFASARNEWGRTGGARAVTPGCGPEARVRWIAPCGRRSAARGSRSTWDPLPTRTASSSMARAPSRSWTPAGPWRWRRRLR